MNLPLDISSRSMASSAVIIGARVKANAIAVPTPIVEVPAAIAAAVIVALRCISGAHTTSAPAASACCETSTISASDSPHGANVNRKLVALMRRVRQSAVRSWPAESGC